MGPPSSRVAVVQAEPAWLDLDGSVSKTVSLIAEAAEKGAELIAFPECWIPGYPAWIWNRPLDLALNVRYTKASLDVNSASFSNICEAAKEHAITVVLGFSERHQGSLYMAQSIISSEGKVLMHRRKIKPTHMERTIFGESSGSSLNNVVDTGKAGRVGALNCWEHAQPLLKYHTATQNEDLHVAAWPPVYPHGAGEPYSMSKEGTHVLSQAYAIEAATFVLHSSSVIGEKGMEVFKNPQGSMMSAPGGGCSAVFAPDGVKMSVDLPDNEEGLIVVDLDYDVLLQARAFLDVGGHYSRPDLLRLVVDKGEKKCVVYV
ncbi:Similar to Aliphatic nitrilase; acc. no. Q02068 [Pyronema omphalodes CBS 100304]|uniref:nitrilase n=1 Tax=Pyronema omphalodes (strain CBS 100304) TaxID=1076935 RepID=U4LHG3_PYROM|nr:Similar to Aliphatic nitrilase; acc. no. Q02068 [Pyronema omphalodes CBS 100304]